LQRSRCFQSSPAMTCTTCHDVHVEQRNAARFSNHCLTCHKEDSCGELKKKSHVIATNCIDCHMPVQESSLIVSGFEGKQVRAKLRSHWIRVYPQDLDKRGNSDQH
jgi:hypothetical protein